MASSGFEGFEKRLELRFFGNDHATSAGRSHGLRLIDSTSLEAVLRAVQCTIVSSVGNRFFDSYVLSESSLFIYPSKVIIKTCGTTKLLKSVRPLVALAGSLGLSARSCRYTRGSFIFREAQPFPHTSFRDEVAYLEDSLPATLCFRKASIMHSKVGSHSWHVFTACDPTSPAADGRRDPDDLFTVEVCMTELGCSQSRKFFQDPGRVGEFTGDTAGKAMTAATSIDQINPDALICDFAFEPCGYSMNGIEGDRYSTIHVTPEDGFSYASYEFVGSVYDHRDDIVGVLRKVGQIFRPTTMSVSVTSVGNDSWSWIAGALEPLGLKRRSCDSDDFPETGMVVFQTFTAARRK
ncbi:hypothetical protein SAY87_009509 [Trapa incisa]|uniref:S-adenosylmethionine decarboxylase proenzyme n=1 Tax=Trapa incisa TaxID=236973 RepID=A0AAN7JZ45_9MYRT|nr:hypothetical protein SAY87_009509 [Trapa incisa]